MSTTDATSTDVVTAESHPELREMIRNLKAQTDMEQATGGTSDFVFSLMEQILNAQTEEEVFELQESGMVAGKDFAGRPFIVRENDIEWRHASAAFIEQGAFPFYAIIRATEIATGDEVVIDCGGKTIVPSLYALQFKHDAFNTDKYPEGRALVIISKPSPAGAYLILRPVRQEPTKAQSSARGKK